MNRVQTYKKSSLITMTKITIFKFTSIKKCINDQNIGKKVVDLNINATKLDRKNYYDYTKYNT